MNILHIKYAVEVARLGSLSKAAESLLTAQPNISRSIKELEASLGITIFSRSSRGTVLTPEGEEFIGFAKDILSQINNVEKYYKNNLNNKQKFSVSVQRAPYITDAFARFTKSISTNPAEVLFMETDFGNTVNNVINKDFNLGIIRYTEKQDKYFKEMFKFKKLAFKTIKEFSYSLILNKKHPLASKTDIYLKDLLPFIEVLHNDILVSPTSVIDNGTDIAGITRKITVFESANVFNILNENREAFAWTSPVSQKTISNYGLVTKACIDYNERFKDVLIFRDDYKLSELDNKFIMAFEKC